MGGWISRRGFIEGGVGLGLGAALPHESRAQATGVVRVRSYADIQVIDPAYTRAAPEGDIARCLFRSLVAFKSSTTWEWAPDAAETIELVDPLTVRFTLKPGIKWSNSFGEMTAEDVKYSYERIADPANKSPYKNDWAKLDQVEVTGPLSGVIRLKQPFAPLFWSTLPWSTGFIMCKVAMEKAGGRFTTEPPATNGPYLLKSWQPKQRTILVRNPDYDGPRPGFDELHVLPIEDEKTAEIAFAAKELEFTAVGAASLPTLKASSPPGSKLLVRPSLAYVWLGMNVEAAPFDDIRVRRAVTKAIDVDAVLDAAYFGAAERANGIIAPGLLGHRSVKPPERDLAGARKLLADAGKSAGFSCTLDLLNTAKFVAAAQVIQANLAEVGITVQINVHDSGTYWSLGDASKGEGWKTLNLTLQRFTMAPDPSWATAWFLPSQIGTWNWQRWNNPEFATLHEEGIVTTDAKKRDAIYVRMQDLMDESGAFLFITHEVSGILQRSGVDPALMPDGRPILAGFQRTA